MAGGEGLIRAPANASDVVIRELTASDRAALAFMFRRLGARSRFQRFLGPGPVLDPAEVNRLTRADHWHHEALIAWSPVPRTPVGVTEYVRLDDFDVAEPAIAVVDGWQRHGIGRELLLALGARAVHAGIRRFAVTTLADNRGALTLARELGRCTVIRDGCAVVELLVELQVGRGRGPPPRRVSPLKPEGWA